MPEQPNDKFVKLHMLKRLLDLERAPVFGDALEVSVRSNQMKGIIIELEVLLNQAKIEVKSSGFMAEETSQAIRAILDRINNESDDYKHYKEPEKRIIAKAAVIQLRRSH